MSDLPKKRMPLGFLIASAIFFAAGLALLVNSGRLSAQVNAKLDANTLQLTADLSKAGEYKGRFVGVEHFSHGFGVFLEFDEPISYSDFLELAGGVEGTWTCSFPELNGPFLCSDFVAGEPGPRKHFMLERFSIARPADGTEVTMTVTKPSAALAGKRYKIVSAYSPCGLEFAAASLWGLGGLVLWVFALVSLVIWAVKAYRHRKAARKAAQQSYGDNPT